MAQGRHLIVGCGYTGLSIARHLQQLGEDVVGTSRSDLRRSEIEATGAKFAQLDLDRGDELPRGPYRSVVLLAPPPGDAERAADRVRHVVEAAKGAPVCVVVSTAIFGDTRGTVTERTHPAPHAGEEARRWTIADAAALYMRSCGHQVMVVRSAEIYGPGRDHRAKLLTGDAFTVRPAPSTSRIHVDDLARLIIACNRKGGPPILLACDELPSPEFRVVAEAARLLGLPAPAELTPEEAADRHGAPRLSGGLAGHSCRSIVRPWLGIRLKYPTYREGLRACLT